MGRYFQTADYKPTIDFLYEPDWALTERVLKTEQENLDNQRAIIEAAKNLQIEHLGGAADAENSKRILDYYKNLAEEYSKNIEANKLDARAYAPNLKNLQNDIAKNYREGEIAGIQSSVLRKQAWEKEHEKFKETNPEYYNHAKSKFMADYISSGGNSLVRGWQGEGLARPIDVEKVTQHAYKLMAEKTGWTRDSTNGTWINSRGEKVEKLEANRVFQNIMGTILADPANQAFMRQSTRLGYMRYLDENGNIDYKSPGLNPFSSIAESISYENRQDDHSMRADDYGKMAKQHQYDIAMENHKSKLRRQEDKEKWERENPPELGTVGGFTDSAFETPEQLQEALQSKNPVVRDKAIAMVTASHSEALQQFLDPQKDKKIYSAVLEYVALKGGNVRLGDAYQHVVNTQFSGYYLPSGDKAKLMTANVNDIMQAGLAKGRLEKLRKNGSITEGQYKKEIKAQDDKIKALADDNKKLAEGKRPKSHRVEPGFLDNVIGQDYETSKKIADGNYNSRMISKLNENTPQSIIDRHKDNYNVVTFSPVDKKTGKALFSSIMGTDGSIAMYDETNKTWRASGKNAIEGFDVVGSYPITSTGEIALKIRDSKGKEKIVKVNSNRNPYIGQYATAVIANNTSKDLEAQTRISPRFKELSEVFMANTVNEGLQPYVSTYKTSNNGTPYRIISNDVGELSVIKLPNNVTSYNPVNDTNDNKNSFGQGTKFKNLTEVAAYLNAN